MDGQLNECGGERDVVSKSWLSFFFCLFLALAF
jgi:hypothetical protein